MITVPTAFHAEMSSTKTHPKNAIYVYDRVVTNEGSAYNKQTGKFTTPATGVYLFAWSVSVIQGRPQMLPYLSTVNIQEESPRITLEDEGSISQQAVPSS